MTSWTLDQITLSPAVCLPAEAGLSQLERLLIDERASDVYLIGRHGDLLGVVPDYELLKWRMLSNPRVARASQLMTPVTHVLSPRTTLLEAAMQLRLHHCRQLPVVDQGKLLGQIDRGTLLRALSAAPLPDRPPLPVGNGPKFLQHAGSENAVSRSIVLPECSPDFNALRG